MSDTASSLREAELRMLGRRFNEAVEMLSRVLAHAKLGLLASEVERVLARCRALQALRQLPGAAATVPACPGTCCDCGRGCAAAPTAAQPVAGQDVWVRWRSSGDVVATPALSELQQASGMWTRYVAAPAAAQPVAPPQDLVAVPRAELEQLARLTTFNTSALAATFAAKADAWLRAAASPTGREASDGHS